MNGRKYVIICASLLLAASLGAQTQTAPAKPGGTKAAPAKKAAAPAAPYKAALLKPAALNARAPESFDVKFVTTKGDFLVRVTRAWAPNGADRFYNLVRNGFFDNASFFRAVPGFVVQFGLSAYPKVSLAWYQAKIKDDAVKQQNKRGTITFATSGPDSRTTQVFINLNDANTQLDAHPWKFAPFGEVIEGMAVVDSLFNGYGEATTNRQGEIMQYGKEYLDKNFPKLDSIKTASIIPPPRPPAPAAASPKGPIRK
jgi:peptidyl-prolyl cis-trans isomerase A (cyclophilin A)